jgi:hypothetical protein
MDAGDTRASQARVCPGCGRAKQDRATLCFRCYLADQRKTPRTEGYAAGLREGRAETRGGTRNDPAAAQLPKERVRQLLQLCRPDRHANSPTSNEITCWLLGLWQVSNESAVSRASPGETRQPGATACWLI